MIKIINIYKVFNDKTVLNDISATLNDKLFYGLFGKNGAGKTTLLNIISKISKPTRGFIEIDDQLGQSTKKLRHFFGILTQTPYYIEEFTPLEYFKFLINLHKIDYSVGISRVNSLSNELRLDIMEKTIIANLSAGNQRKVSIIGTLIHDPAFLVYDEPFSNLDFEAEERISNLLQSFRGRKGMIISMHDIAKAVPFCDQYLVISNSKLNAIFAGPGEDLLSTEEHIKKAILS